jgi:radical SAM protein with 4Fe4S-binding SPASM domain
MKRKWKLSAFSEKVSTKKGIILWNRIWGGAVCVSATSYELLSGSRSFDQEEVPKETFSLLVSQNIIFEENYDEKQLVERERSKLVAEVSPRNLRCLELSVSEECNYRCIYCTFWRQKKGNNQNTRMSRWLANKAILDFLNVTRDIAEPIIYFGTAEPLLNWDVIEEVAILAPKLHPGVKMSLITNGSMMNEKRLWFCKNHKVNVGISLDGRPETQNRQRIPFDQALNSSEAVFKLLRIADRIGFRFTCISGTYRNANFIEDIDYLINLCEKYQIPEVDIDFDARSIHLTVIEKLTEELLYAYRMAKKAGLRIFGYWLVPFMNILNYERKLKSFCGNSVGRSVCISSDGNFKLCGYQPEPIKPYDLLEYDIASPELARSLEKQLQRRNNCINCVIEGVCSGQCFLNLPSEQTWGLACDLYKEVTFALLKNHFGA